jgi:hypothetical protein
MVQNELLEPFGGGGHPKAAACSLKCFPSDLELKVPFHEEDRTAAQPSTESMVRVSTAIPVELNATDAADAWLASPVQLSDVYNLNKSIVTNASGFVGYLLQTAMRDQITAPVQVQQATVRCMHVHNLMKSQACHIMTSPALTCSPNDTIGAVEHRMQRYS